MARLMRRLARRSAPGVFIAFPAAANATEPVCAGLDPRASIVRFVGETCERIVAERRTSPNRQGEALGKRWRYHNANERSGERDLAGDLRCADLSMADLRGARIKEAILDFSDLREANFQEAVVSSTQFRYANLRGAVLRGAKFEPPAHFGSADLRCADLRGVTFPTWYPKPDRVHSSTFDEVRFDGADLRGVDFNRALIFGAVFDGADLRGTNLADTIPLPKSMRGARYDRHTRLPDWIDPKEWHMIYVPAQEPSD